MFGTRCFKFPTQALEVQKRYYHNLKMLGTIDWLRLKGKKTEILVCFDLKKINWPNLLAEFFVLHIDKSWTHKKIKSNFLSDKKIITESLWRKKSRHELSVIWKIGISFMWPTTGSPERMFTWGIGHHQFWVDPLTLSVTSVVEFYGGESTGSRF